MVQVFLYRYIPEIVRFSLVTTVYIHLLYVYRVVSIYLTIYLVSVPSAAPGTVVIFKIYLLLIKIFLLLLFLVGICRGTGRHF